uniref:Uncharacterized protein n=1 Tax=Rhizophora mucronata TaxID=61149 RepID=A0A2P2PTL9_RHIMU
MNIILILSIKFNFQLDSHIQFEFSGEFSYCSFILTFGSFMFYISLVSKFKL